MTNCTRIKLSCAHVGRQRSLQLKVGQWVYVDSSNIIRNADKRLCVRWLGPFPIEQVINARTYKLELPDKYRIKNVFNVARLMACHDSSLPQLSIETDDKGIEHIVYEIDKIVSHVLKGRRNKTVTGVLVHFKGYTDQYNLWQPVDDIASSAPILLKDYIIRHNLRLDSKTATKLEAALST